MDSWFCIVEQVCKGLHMAINQALCWFWQLVDCRREKMPPYQPGDRVWLATRDVHLNLPSSTLSLSYIDPFFIMRAPHLHPRNIRYGFSLHLNYSHLS